MSAHVSVFALSPRIPLAACVMAFCAACTASVVRPDSTARAHCSLTPVSLETPPAEAPAASEPEPPALPPPVDPSASAEPPPMWCRAPIEDPGGHALEAFHAALARAERGEGQAHLLFFGASHVASDLFTDVLRVKLQRRFGEAGAGFFMPLKARPAYRNGSIDFDRPSGFRTTHVKAASLKPDRYGLAGMYVTTGSKAAVSAFSTRAHGGLTGHASRLELFYEKRPGGGALELNIDGKPHSLNTAARHVEAAYADFDVEDGPHHIELHVPAKSRVRIYGMTAERNLSGVVLDTLGIPGARAGYQLLWNDELYREHLTRRKPDLVVLAYGTNEAGDDDVPIASYEATLRNVVSRVQAMVPDASCLLVGPSDRPVRNPDETFSDRPRTEEIVAAQRRVAANLGCGFFDVVAFMGGPMAMLRWVEATPPLGTPDHIHFRLAGYQALGEVLYDALLQGYSGPEALDRASADATEASSTTHISASPGTPQSP